MNPKIRLLFCVFLAIIFLTIIAEPVFGWGYITNEERRRASGGDFPYWEVFYIIAGIITLFILLYRLNKGKRGLNTVDLNSLDIRFEVPSHLYKDKLLPNEQVIGQISWADKNFVATSSRLLKFASGEFEALKYQQIDNITKGFKRNPVSVKIVGTVIIVFMCLLLVIGLAVTGYVPLLVLIGSLIYILDALIIILNSTYFSRVIHYQVISKDIDKNAQKFWRLPPENVFVSKVIARVNADWS